MFYKYTLRKIINWLIAQWMEGLEHKWYLKKKRFSTTLSVLVNFLLSGMNWDGGKRNSMKLVCVGV